MDSFGIIPSDILINTVIELLIRVECGMVQLFIFDDFEEAFCHGIVPAIAFPTH